MAKGKQSTSKKNAYASYPIRYVKNRTRKLQRHLRNHPDDAASKAALASIHYRRKKPQHKVWSPTKKALAQQLRAMGLNGNLALSLGDRRNKPEITKL